MKRIGMFVLLCLVLLSKSVWATPVEVLREGFENGIPAGAVITGPATRVNNVSGAHAGSYRLQMVGDSDPSTVASLMLPLDLTGYEDAVLDVWYKFGSGIEGGDIATISVSVDGGATQTNLVTYQDQAAGGWTNSILPLPPITNDQPMVQVLFVGDFNGATGDSLSFDDVVITANVVPEPGSGLALCALAAVTVGGLTRKKK